MEAIQKSDIQSVKTDYMDRALGLQSQALLMFDIFWKTFTIYISGLSGLNLVNLTALWHLSSTVYYALRFKFNFVAKK